MENQLLFGTTSKADEFVKIQEIPTDKINSVFPDISIESPVEFSYKWNLSDDQYFYIDLSTDTGIIDPFQNVIQTSASYNQIVKNQFSKLDCLFMGSLREETCL